MTVEWDPSGGQVGYKVHVGVQSGSYTQHFDVGSATTFTFQSATAGQRYCFAVSAYLLSSQLEGPNSGEVCGYSNAPPTLVNPGNRTSTVGQSVTLQLVGSDPASQPLTYSATGLPAGSDAHGEHWIHLRYADNRNGLLGDRASVRRHADGIAVVHVGHDGASRRHDAADRDNQHADDRDEVLDDVLVDVNMGGTARTTSASRRSGGRTIAAAAVSRVERRTGASPAFRSSSGANVITVTAFDAAGNQGTDALTVTYTTHDSRHHEADDLNQYSDDRDEPFDDGLVGQPRWQRRRQRGRDASQVGERSRRQRRRDRHDELERVRAFRC